MLTSFCKKLEELKIFLAPSLLHTFCPPFKFAGCKIFQGKPKFLPLIGFQKRWPCPLHSFGLTDMQVMTLSKSILEKLPDLTSKIFDQSLFPFLVPVSLLRCLLPPWGSASPPVSPLTFRCSLSGSEPEVRPAVPFRASFQGPE